MLTNECYFIIGGRKLKIKILAFGIAKDIFKSNSIYIELNMNDTIANLKQLLEDQFPQLLQLKSYLIAVNNEYVQPNYNIKKEDEIAIIPPVSGG
jgi:molybdopterin synthase sulfur carrier subunit